MAGAILSILTMLFSDAAVAAAAQPTIPTCLARDFVVSIGSAGGAAGTQYTNLIFKKHFLGTCRIKGIPTAQPVLGAKEVKVGPLSVKDTASDMGGWITLAGYGATASVQFATVTAANYPKAKCAPKFFDGVVLIFPVWKGTNSHQYFPLKKNALCTKISSTRVSAVVSGSIGE